MQTYIPCPNCNLLLSPPLKASKEARLRCPLCQHEQTAGDLLFGTHNQWQVIEDPGGEDLFSDFQNRSFVERNEFEKTISALNANAPSDVNSSTEIGSNFDLLKPPSRNIGIDESSDDQKTEDGEYRLAEEDPANTNSVSNSSNKELNWKQFEPISHEQFQRNRRKSGSPIRTIVQVVLGGLVALPISQLLIWHLVKKDPFDLGPQIAAYLPWIVPESFHGLAQGNSTDPEVRIADRPKRNNITATGEIMPGESLNSNLDQKIQTQTNDVVVKENPSQKTNASAGQLGNAPLTASEPFSAAVLELETALTDWKDFDDASPVRKREIAQNYYGKLKSLAANQPSRSNTNATNPWIRKQSKLLKRIADNTRLRTVAQKGAEFDLQQCFSSDQSAMENGFACVVEILGSSEDRILQSPSLPPETRIQLSDFWQRRSVLPGRYFVLGVISSNPKKNEKSDDTEQPSETPPNLSAEILELLEIRFD